MSYFLAFVLLLVTIAHFSEIKRFLHFKTEYYDFGMRPHITLEKCENAALFLRSKTYRPNQSITKITELCKYPLQTGEIWKRSFIASVGLPSTLIRHENRAFCKRSSNWTNVKMLTFCQFKTKLIENGHVIVVMWFPRLWFPSTQIQNNQWLWRYRKDLMRLQFQIPLAECGRGLDLI